MRVYTHRCKLMYLFFVHRIYRTILPINGRYIPPCTDPEMFSGVDCMHGGSEG